MLFKFHLYLISKCLNLFYQINSQVNYFLYYFDFYFHLILPINSQNFSLLDDFTIFMHIFQIWFHPNFKVLLTKKIAKNL